MPFPIRVLPLKANVEIWGMMVVLPLNMTYTCLGSGIRVGSPNCHVECHDDGIPVVLVLERYQTLVLCYCLSENPELSNRGLSFHLGV